MMKLCQDHTLSLHFVGARTWEGGVGGSWSPSKDFKMAGYVRYLRYRMWTPARLSGGRGNVITPRSYPIQPPLETIQGGCNETSTGIGGSVVFERWSVRCGDWDSEDSELKI